MRLGLVSDTHGELENLRDALTQLIRMRNVEQIVHLGDEWEDSAVFQELPGVETFAVPGVYAREYLEPAIPNRVARNIAGWEILFTHTPEAHANDLPEDPDPRELAAAHRVDVVAYGHTHIPSAEEKDYVLWVNPGHLKSRDKKGRAPSYAVLDIAPEKITVEIIDLLSKETFLRKVFVKKKITVCAPGLRLRAVLNNTGTAQKIWDVLPVQGRANLWGDEIYFSVPVALELESPRETVQLGDIGYWPPGQAICFFFGPTPVSRGEEIRPYSPVTVAGKIIDNPGELKRVGENETVEIARFW